MCFYPMNKSAKSARTGFLLSKEDRSRLMIEHARSGMAFAGRVSQLITVGVGLEDWEWGVTLWAANPEFLKEIVYRMRSTKRRRTAPNSGRSIRGTSPPRKKFSATAKSHSCTNESTYGRRSKPISGA